MAKAPLHVGTPAPTTPTARPPPPLFVRNTHFRDAAPGWIARRHRHRIPQWYWCSYGSVDIVVGDTVHHLKSEHSVLVSPDAEREVRVEHRAAGYLVTMFEVEPQFGFATVFDRVLPLPGEARDDAHALAAEVRRPGGVETRLLVTALTTRVLVALLRSQRRQASEPLSGLNAASHAGVVAQAESFMQRNLYRSLKRAEIAAAVNLSEPHLGRLFRATIGRSIIDRLVELRIEQAQMLLLESSMSVTQVASAVGITSFSYFSKVFRRLVGLSPSDFRRAGGRVYS